MATLKRGAGDFDRRVTLYRPKTRQLGPNNPFNQLTKEYEPDPVYRMYPAKRLNSLTEIDQKENANIVRAVGEVEWHLQYVPGLGNTVKANWLLVDELDGTKYELKTPLTENDRGKSYRVIANKVE